MFGCVHRRCKKYIVGIYVCAPLVCFHTLPHLLKCIYTVGEQGYMNIDAYKTIETSPEKINNYAIAVSEGPFCPLKSGPV